MAAPTRDWHGRFASIKTEDTPQSPPLVQVTTFKKPKLTSEIPPVIDLKVTNPVTYLKLWWRKLMSGEGISVRIHPITAVLIALAVSGSSFFLGRYLQLRSDLIDRYLPQLANLNTINTAFTGTLYSAEGDYYLAQGQSQAIRLKPNNLPISPYLGQPVFVSGRFDPLTRTLTLVTINLQTR